MKKTIITIFCLGLLSACATFKALQPTEADAVRGQDRFHGLTLDELNQGKTFFETKCAKCHSLRRPFIVSEKALIKVMPKMTIKAKIDNKTQDEILKYLLVMKGAKKQRK